MPAERIPDLLHGRRAITADIALRRARFSTMEARFRMNLQTRYDAGTAAASRERIGQEVAPLVVWRARATRSTLAAARLHGPGDSAT